MTTATLDAPPIANVFTPKNRNVDVYGRRWFTLSELIKNYGLKRHWTKNFIDKGHIIKSEADHINPTNQWRTAYCLKQENDWLSEDEFRTRWDLGGLAFRRNVSNFEFSVRKGVRMYRFKDHRSYSNVIAPTFESTVEDALPTETMDMVFTSSVSNGRSKVGEDTVTCHVIKKRDTDPASVPVQVNLNASTLDEIDLPASIIKEVFELGRTYAKLESEVDAAATNAAKARIYTGLAAADKRIKELTT